MKRNKNWIQTRIKSRERYNESSPFCNNVMKCQKFRALQGRGETPPSLHPPPMERASRAHYRPPPPKMKSWLRAWTMGDTRYKMGPLVMTCECRVCRGKSMTRCWLVNWSLFIPYFTLKKQFKFFSFLFYTGVEE